MCDIILCKSAKNAIYDVFSALFVYLPIHAIHVH